MYSYLTPNGNTFWCAEDIGTNVVVPANWVTTGGWSLLTGTDNLQFNGFGGIGTAILTCTTVTNQLYKLQFVVSYYTGPATYSVVIASGTYINTTIVDINAIGVYEYYFIPSGISTTISISETLANPSTPTDIVTIESISFSELNVNITKDRLRCTDLIINPCNGSPGGGGLPGDCGETVINNGLILCDDTDSWNCNLCSNDLPYYNPILITDIIQFQFQQWDYMNGQYPWNGTDGWGTMCKAEVYDCCTDTPLLIDVLAFTTQNFVGIYNVKGYNGLDNWTNIQQIELDLDMIWNTGYSFNPNWDGCFYLKFIFNDAGGNPVNSFYSEPYRFEKCDDTILLEGYSSRKDCFGYYYGDPAANPQNWYGVGQPFQYRNMYRVKGSFELDGFEINKNFVGTRQFTANTERSEIWMFRTNRLPNRVARLISGILACETVYIENRDYIASGTISKNNEIGNQWFLESQLKRVTCSQTTSCD